DYRTRLRNHYSWLAEVHLRLGHHTQAARAAVECPHVIATGWEEYHRAALFLTRCVALAKKDSRLTVAERDRTADTYAEQAVRMLRDAVKHGYQPSIPLGSDPNFILLRDRNDFKQLPGGAGR